MTLLALAAAPASAQDAPGLFHDLGTNVADSFTGWNLALHLGGVGATAVMSPSGADYEIHRFFAERPELGEPTFPAVAAGTLAPFLVGGSLLGYGWIADDSEELAGGWAVLQASALAFAYVNILKAITGRPPPPEDDPTADARALSEKWRFGILRGGVFHGWPSGHTIVATALTSSLAHYYTDRWWVGALSYTWAAYTAYSVISFDEGSMHWASDMVAGALMGYAIGSTVGKSYRQAVDGVEEDDDGVTFRLAPQVGNGTMGLQWSAQF